MTPEQRERLEDLSKIQPTHYIGEIDRAAIRAALDRIVELESVLTNIVKEHDNDVAREKHEDCLYIDDIARARAILEKKA